MTDCAHNGWNSPNSCTHSDDIWINCGSKDTLYNTDLNKFDASLISIDAKYEEATRHTHIIQDIDYYAEVTYRVSYYISSGTCYNPTVNICIYINVQIYDI